MPPAPARWTDSLRRLFGRKPAAINLALQGGGAHGAFTWGVLDALLDDGRFEFDGVSGTSAGAMNAVLLAEGWRRGGRDGARAALEAYWTALGRTPGLGLLVQGEGDDIVLSSTGKFMLQWAGLFSPAQLNPLDLNPLRELLRQQVDFTALAKGSPFRLFIAATQANSGKVRLFREHELNAEVLLASACLPKIHRTVTIDGEPYWDGGYAANPAVYPLFYDCHARDILLVLLSPLQYASTPRSAEEISARTLELAFSAHFMREMRMFVHAADYAAGAWLPLGRLERRLRGTRFHMIDIAAQPTLQRTDTKALAHGPFLEHLRTQGRSCAQAWIDAHGDAVGRRTTVDLARWFS